MEPPLLKPTIDIFLSQGHLKTGTRKAYKQALTALIRNIGEDTPINEIESLEVQKFWNRLSSRNYSPHTINKHLRSLKTFFNWCIATNLIEISPANGLKRPRIPHLIPRNKAMTNEEYNTILSFARKTSPRNYALILFIGDTGCRAIAASRLQRHDIDFENQCAVVTGKGDRQRVVYFGEVCNRALLDWLRMKPVNTGNYVFRERVNNDGSKGPVNSDSISYYIRETGRKAGLVRSLGSHSLRHRKGYQLADSKTPLTVSMKALGHSNSDTTQGYYPDDDERVRNKMAELATQIDPSIKKKIDEKIIPLKNVKRR